MKPLTAYHKYYILGFIGISLLVACSLEKKSAINRGLQNLTARYNILFNANELLRQKQEIYAASFVDDYSEILRVYQDTTAHNGQPDRELDGVLGRGHNIINIKEQSHYIGDAYMLLAKASYLYGDYFNANEYCNYVVHSYPNDPRLVMEARNWQVRTLLNLHQLSAAKAVSDSALYALTVAKKKYNNAGVYAARLQYDIDAGDLKEGEAMAKAAIKEEDDVPQRRREVFILAQLQERMNKPAEAYANYSRIVKSNAVFEMAFNAELNRIRIEDTQNNRRLSHLDRLRNLLRNENNKDFIDQIYFQIGEQDMAEGKTEEAIKNYRMAINHSTKNQNQKGLAYLRLADINFKIKTDYVTAKRYYDSTLLNLLPTYPGYHAIQLKANNLQILAEQLRIIAHEDTLQQLAKLDENARNARIDELTKQHVTQLQIASAAAAPPLPNNYSGQTVVTPPATTSTDASTFYFYNTNALSQGFTDFKRRWGNRKLEDNWRRSTRSNSDITINTQNPTQNIDNSVLTAQQQKSKEEIAADNFKQQLVQNLPLTAQAMANSNNRVYAAYFNIGNFYRDILEDPKEAIGAYETLLTRFPNNDDKAAIYYNLYRLYSNINIEKSDYYKNLLLKDYPATAFAKIILDPSYAQKLNDQDAEFNASYNDLYNLYAHKQYTDVINQADQVLTRYPSNKFAAQIAYLKAVAQGHQEKLAPFQAELIRIAAQYPEDRLITPLINQHLAYIQANQAELAARPVVLVDNDFTINEFIPAPVVQQQVAQQPAPNKQPVATPATKQPEQQQPAPANRAQKPTAAPVKQAPQLFSLRDSSRYYFVINVSTGTTNLSSSRFGIGQFNRANYDPSAGVTHQLTTAGPDNQLIYVGVFPSLAAVKNYARAIIPLLPDIMKVPKDKYSFFIITRENLDKLADKKMLDNYIDFYQKNY
ncbi:type IX secretion system periplasmic lipoprotein PorW/SprE [Mucilaginibacter sp. KACC 22063]|uniref:type IX secretion system periplasmic lipoprotein PorW/SprE n=1 Tax=Mucilaginibacter sp. KACC 22063 TaxID=3025666 RepID=UPI0023667868|nr:tetratricopeptide repeat protein [Mucilaginibacter sp. KACC 22063]WDF56240.1 tetratricopeptide repeat protein [Mucilaginibacter sp. KACC 22063]